MFLFYQPHYFIQESIKNIQNFYLYFLLLYLFLFAHTIWLFYSLLSLRLYAPCQSNYITFTFLFKQLYFYNSLIFFLVFVKFFYTHQQGRNKKVILFFGHCFLDKRNFITRNIIPQRFFLNLVIRQDLFHLLVIKFYWLKVISALFITIQYQKFLLH